MNLIGRKLRQFGIFNGILALSLGLPILHAETKLTAANSTSSSLVIRLENDKPIAALQFVLRSSSNIVLTEIHKSGRTAAENWIVTSNLINDSTLSVVIVCGDMSFFSIGNGVVAEVSFSMRADASTSEKVALTGVVGADPQAQLVNVTTSDLTLDSRIASSSNSSLGFSIGKNYPNPFNPSTRITYELKNDAHVNLAIFDITGREISRLVDQYQSKGTYTATWNSSENRWGQLSSGTYFARLQVGDKVATQKMLLTK